MPFATQIPYVWKLKNKTNEWNIQNRNKLTDIENKLMMTKVDKEEGRDKLGLWD